MPGDEVERTTVVNQGVTNEEADSDAGGGGALRGADVVRAQVDGDRLTLEDRVAAARARLHRSIGQRARWARHDFLRALRTMEGQALFLRGLSGPQDVVV
jgi:hypothetical protein